MVPSELLVIIAEVAAVLAGISMVVGLLRPDSPADEERFFAIRDVAEIGLMTLAGLLFVSAAFRSLGRPAT